MTSFFSKKPIFRQPKSSLVVIPSAQIGHSAYKALFPPELIPQVVVSSLLSTLTSPSLLFLSPLFPLFPTRTPTLTTPVFKFFFPTTLLYNSLTSTLLPSEALLLTLAPGPSILTCFQILLILLSLETLMLTTQHGTESFPKPARK